MPRKHAGTNRLSWSPNPGAPAAAAALARRVFSLDPIEGYRPPTLTGHKGPLVALHLTSRKVQEAAGLLDKAAPCLYTVSRDGALFAWAYNKPAAEVGRARVRARLLDGLDALIVMAAWFSGERWGNCVLQGVAEERRGMSESHTGLHWSSRGQHQRQ